MKNKESLYIIKENGKNFCFYSKQSGYSYPFIALGFLMKASWAVRNIGLEEQGICSAPLLEQLKGNNLFPEEQQGQKIFRRITREVVEYDSWNKNTFLLAVIDLDGEEMILEFQEKTGMQTITIHMDECQKEDLSEKAKEYQKAMLTEGKDVAVWEAAERVCSGKIKTAMECRREQASSQRML